MKIIGKIKLRIQSLLWYFFWNNFQLPELTIEQVTPKYMNYEPKIYDHICLPPYAGNKGYKDYSILISLIKEEKPIKILELGTAHGNTVTNICFESNAEIITVNALPYQIEGNIITFTLDQDEIGIVFKTYGFENRVTQIYENTRKIDILDYLHEKSVDFAFIDACHDPEFVVSDFLSILPSLSNTATVLFHDTHPSGEKHLLDSYIGCMFLRKMGYNIKHIEDSTLGFWVGNDSINKLDSCMKIKNQIHTLIGHLIYGNNEKFIKGLRWLASKFYRNKQILNY